MYKIVNKTYFKAVSWAVAALFLWDTLVWANPDIFSGNSRNSCLQPALLSWAPADRSLVEYGILSLISALDCPIEDIKLHLYPTIHGKRVDLFFDRKEKLGANWLVPCNIGGKRFNAFIDPIERSVTLADGEEKAAQAAALAGPRIDSEETERQIIAILGLGHSSSLFDAMDPLNAAISPLMYMGDKTVNPVEGRMLSGYVGRMNAVLERIRLLVETVKLLSREDGTVTGDEMRVHMDELQDIVTRLKEIKSEILETYISGKVAGIPSHQDFRSPALKSCVKALRLLQNRLDSANGIVTFSPELPGAVLEEVIAPRPSARRTGEFPEAVVMCDRRALKSALNNVFRNAEYFARAAKGDDAEVLVSLSTEGDKVKIEIKDNGDGIPAEMLEADPVTGRPRLFTLNASLREGGSGVGLAETWFAIRAFGGSIEVKSEKGKGAFFEIFLPAIEPVTDITKDDETQKQVAPSERINGLDVVWTGTRTKTGLRMACAEIEYGDFENDTSKMAEIVRGLKAALGEDAPDLVVFPEESRMQADYTAEEKVIARQKTLEQAAIDTGMTIGFSAETDTKVLYYYIGPGGGKAGVRTFVKGHEGLEDRMLPVPTPRGEYKIYTLICSESSGKIVNDGQREQFPAMVRDADLVFIPSNLAFGFPAYSASLFHEYFGKPTVVLNEGGAQKGGSFFAPANVMTLLENESILMVDISKDEPDDKGTDTKRPEPGPELNDGEYPFKVPGTKITGPNKFKTGKAPGKLSEGGAIHCNYLFAYDPAAKVGAVAHSNLSDLHKLPFEEAIEAVSGGIEDMADVLSGKGADKSRLQFVIVRTKLGRKGLAELAERLSIDNQRLLAGALYKLGYPFKTAATRSGPVEMDMDAGRIKVANGKEIARFRGMKPVKETDTIMQAIGKLAALALMPFTLFVMLVSAPVIKLTSRGPVFYRQERVGEGGKPITVWKLRTMTTEDAPAERTVTLFGKMARLPGFDEIPQLLSIIKGDMQWFGPRPYVPDEIDQDYIDAVLHGTKPGLFSLRALKVHGEGWERRTDIPKKETDIEYLSRKSWIYNTEIFIKTIVFVHVWGLVKRLVAPFRTLERKVAPGEEPSAPAGLRILHKLIAPFRPYEMYALHDAPELEEKIFTLVPFAVLSTLLAAGVLGLYGFLGGMAFIYATFIALHAVNMWRAPPEVTGAWARLRYAFKAPLSIAAFNMMTDIVFGWGLNYMVEGLMPGIVRAFFTVFFTWVAYEFGRMSHEQTNKKALKEGDHAPAAVGDDEHRAERKAQSEDTKSERRTADDESHFPDISEQVTPEEKLEIEAKDEVLDILFSALGEMRDAELSARKLFLAYSAYYRKFKEYPSLKELRYIAGISWRETGFAFFRVAKALHHHGLPRMKVVLKPRGAKKLSGLTWNLEEEERALLAGEPGGYADILAKYYLPFVRKHKAQDAGGMEQRAKRKAQSEGTEPEPRPAPRKPRAADPEPKKTVNGFNIYDIGPREIDYAENFVRDGDSVRIEPSESYYAVLGTCVALIIFNDDGTPISFTHFRTRDFHEGQLEDIRDLLAPDKRYLIIPGMFHGIGRSENYGDRLAAYLKTLRIPEENIYIHDSEYMQKDDVYLMSDMMVTVNGDGTVSIDYPRDDRWSAGSKATEVIEHSALKTQDPRLTTKDVDPGEEEKYPKCFNAGRRGAQEITYRDLEFVEKYDGVCFGRDKEHYISTRSDDFDPYHSLKFTPRTGEEAYMLRETLARALALFRESTIRSFVSDKADEAVLDLYASFWDDVRRHEGLLIRVARNLPWDSALYETGGVSVLVLNEEFFEDALLGYYLPHEEGEHKNTALWLLCERLNHELSHSGVFNDDENEEMKEEARCVYRDLLFLKLVLLAVKNLDLKKKVDMYVKNLKNRYGSNDYYKFLYGLTGMSKNKARSKIWSYVTKHYKDRSFGIKSFPSERRRDRRREEGGRQGAGREAHGDEEAGSEPRTANLEPRTDLAEDSILCKLVELLKQKDIDEAKLVLLLKKLELSPDSKTLCSAIDLRKYGRPVGSSLAGQAEKAETKAADMSRKNLGGRTIPNMIFGDIGRIAYELSHNCMKRGDGGVILMEVKELEDDTLFRIVARDLGKGIEDLEEAREKSALVSTAGKNRGHGLREITAGWSPFRNGKVVYSTRGKEWTYDPENGKFEITGESNVETGTQVVLEITRKQLLDDNPPERRNGRPPGNGGFALLEAILPISGLAALVLAPLFTVILAFTFLALWKIVYPESWYKFYAKSRQFGSFKNITSWNRPYYGFSVFARRMAIPTTGASIILFLIWSCAAEDLLSLGVSATIINSPVFFLAGVITPLFLSPVLFLAGVAAAGKMISLCFLLSQKIAKGTGVSLEKNDKMVASKYAALSRAEEDNILAREVLNIIGVEKLKSDPEELARTALSNRNEEIRKRAEKFLIETLKHGEYGPEILLKVINALLENKVWQVRAEDILVNMRFEDIRQYPEVLARVGAPSYNTRLREKVRDCIVASGTCTPGDIAQFIKKLSSVEEGDKLLAFWIEALEAMRKKNDRLFEELREYPEILVRIGTYSDNADFRAGVRDFLITEGIYTAENIVGFIKEMSPDISLDQAFTFWTELLADMQARNNSSLEEVRQQMKDHYDLIVAELAVEAKKASKVERYFPPSYEKKWFEGARNVPVVIRHGKCIDFTIGDEPGEWREVEVSPGYYGTIVTMTPRYYELERRINILENNIPSIAFDGIEDVRELGMLKRALDRLGEIPRAGKHPVRSGEYKTDLSKLIKISPGRFESLLDLYLGFTGAAKSSLRHRSESTGYKILHDDALAELVRKSDLERLEPVLDLARRIAVMGFSVNDINNVFTSYRSDLSLKAIMPAAINKFQNVDMLKRALNEVARTLRFMKENNLPADDYINQSVPFMMLSIKDPSRALIALQTGRILAEKGCPNCAAIGVGMPSVNRQSKDKHIGVFALAASELIDETLRMASRKELDFIARGMEISEIRDIFDRKVAVIMKRVEPESMKYTSSVEGILREAAMLSMLRHQQLDYSVFPDHPTAMFLKFLKENDLNDIVVVSGAVNSLFRGTSPKDFDITVRISLSANEADRLENMGALTTESMYQKSLPMIDRLARLLGITREDILHDSEKSQFMGIPIHYLGPHKTEDGKMGVPVAVNSNNNEFLTAIAYPSAGLIGLGPDREVYDSYHGVFDLYSGKARLAGRNKNELNSVRPMSVLKLLEFVFADGFKTDQDYSGLFKRSVFVAATSLQSLKKVPGGDSFIDEAKNALSERISEILSRAGEGDKRAFLSVLQDSGFSKLVDIEKFNNKREEASEGSAPAVEERKPEPEAPAGLRFLHKLVAPFRPYEMYALHDAPELEEKIFTLVPFAVLSTLLAAGVLGLYGFLGGMAFIYATFIALHAVNMWRAPPEVTGAWARLRYAFKAPLSIAAFNMMTDIVFGWGLNYMVEGLMPGIVRAFFTVFFTWVAYEFGRMSHEQTNKKALKEGDHAPASIEDMGFFGGYYSPDELQLMVGNLIKTNGRLRKKAREVVGKYGLINQAGLNDLTGEVYSYLIAASAMSAGLQSYAQARVLLLSQLQNMGQPEPKKTDSEWSADSAGDRPAPNSFICQGEKAREAFASAPKTDITAEYRERLLGLLETALSAKSIPEEKKTELHSLREKLADGTCKIYGFNAVVRGTDDFFLGRNNAENDELFIPTDLINALSERGPPSLADEYLLHELICPSMGHYPAILVQQGIFPEHYPDKLGLSSQSSGSYYKGILGIELRRFIDNNIVIPLDNNFNLEGATIEQKEYPQVTLHKAMEYPIIEVKLNGKTYRMGNRFYVVITLANGKKIYWGGQHNLSYSFFFEHYNEKAQDMIDMGGISWKHVDMHSDTDGYEAIPDRPAGTKRSWEDEAFFGVDRLWGGNYLAHLQKRGVIKKLDKIRGHDDLVAAAADVKNIAGVTDVDIDVILHKHDDNDETLCRQTFNRMKPYLVDLAEKGHVCFITNSSEITRYGNKPLHIKPGIAVPCNGELLEELARRASKLTQAVNAVKNARTDEELNATVPLVIRGMDNGDFSFLSFIPALGRALKDGMKFAKWISALAVMGGQGTPAPAPDERKGAGVFVPIKDGKAFAELEKLLLNERYFSWGEGREKVNAQTLYFRAGKRLRVFPSKETREANPELAKLDRRADTAFVPDQGMFGMVEVQELLADKGPALWIKEVQPSIGIRSIKREENRDRYRPWNKAAVEHIMALAKRAGYTVFYASTPEEIRYRYANEKQLNQGNLKENYKRPFRDEWQKTDIVVGRRQTKLWHRTESERARSEAEPPRRGRTTNDGSIAILDTFTISKEDLVNQTGRLEKIHEFISCLHMDRGEEIFSVDFSDISGKIGALVYFAAGDVSHNRHELVFEVLAEIGRNFKDHVWENSGASDFSIEFHIVQRKSDSRKGLRMIFRSEGGKMDIPDIMRGGNVRFEITQSHFGMERGPVRGIFFIKLSRIAKKFKDIFFTVESHGTGMRFAQAHEEFFKSGEKNNRITVTIFENEEGSQVASLSSGSGSESISAKGDHKPQEETLEQEQRLTPAERVDAFLKGRAGAVRKGDYDHWSFREKREVYGYLGLIEGSEERTNSMEFFIGHFFDRIGEDLLEAYAGKATKDGHEYVHLSFMMKAASGRGLEFSEYFYVDGNFIGHGITGIESRERGNYIELRMGLDDASYKGKGHMQVFFAMRQGLFMTVFQPAALMVPTPQVSSWDAFFFYVRKGYLPVDPEAKRIVTERFLIPWLMDSNFRIDDPEEVFGEDFIERCGDAFELTIEPTNDERRTTINDKRTTTDHRIPADADWTTVFDDNSMPLMVEVGFGKGVKLAKMAEKNPDTNYIGIECDEANVELLNRRLAREGKSLPNLKLVYAKDGVAFGNQKKKGIITEIYYVVINTSDVLKYDRGTISDLLKTGGRLYVSHDGRLSQVKEKFEKMGFKDVTDEARFPHGSDEYSRWWTHEFVVEKAASDHGAIKTSKAWKRLAGIGGMFPSCFKVAQDESGTLLNRQQHVLRGLEIAARYAGWTGRKTDPEKIRVIAYAHELGRLPFAHYPEKRLASFFREYKEVITPITIGSEVKKRYNQALAQEILCEENGIRLDARTREDINNILLKRPEAIVTDEAKFFFLADALLGYVEDFILTYKLSHKGRRIVEDFPDRARFLEFVFGTSDLSELDTLDMEGFDGFVVRAALRLMERVVNKETLTFKKEAMEELRRYRDNFEAVLFPKVDALVRLNDAILPIFGGAIRRLKERQPAGLSEREKERNVFRELLRMDETDLVNLSGSRQEGFPPVFSWERRISAERVIPARSGYGILRDMIAGKKTALKRPVVVGIDGDPGAGKTVFTDSFASENAGEYAVIHLDRYMTKSDEEGVIDWEGIGNAIQALAGNADLAGILVEGYGLLNGENEGHFTCDIRVNVFADPRTRWENIEKSDPQFSNEGIMQMVALKQFYGFDVDYDLKLDNSVAARREVVKNAAPVKAPGASLSSGAESESIPAAGTTHDSRFTIHDTLRDLADPDELSRSIAEMILSTTFNRKLVLAFDSDIAACQAGGPMGICEALEKLKEDPKFEKILRNLVIVKAPAEELASKLDRYAGEKDAEILVFAAENAREILKKLESRVRSTYINEKDFPMGSYYPLAEVIAISLAQLFEESIPENSMVTVLRAGSREVALKDLNIESIARKNNVLIFKLLPDAEPCDTGELIKKYAEIKRVLRAA